MSDIRIIDLSMYSSEFRKGFDAASVSMALRENMILNSAQAKPQSIFVKIHEESIPICQGICSENLAFSEVVDELPVKINFDLEDGEVWLKIFMKSQNRL